MLYSKVAFAMESSLLGDSSALDFSSNRGVGHLKSDPGTPTRTPYMFMGG